MVNVDRGDGQGYLLASRNVQLPNGEDRLTLIVQDLRIGEYPVEPLSRHCHRIGVFRRITADLEQDGDHWHTHESDDHQRGDDRPAYLQRHVAVRLLGDRVVLAAAEAQQHDDDPALHEEPHQRRERVRVEAPPAVAERGDGSGDRSMQAVHQTRFLRARSVLATGFSAILRMNQGYQ